jgi:hypothetical protein
MLTLLTSTSGPALRIASSPSPLEVSNPLTYLESVSNVVV